MRPAFAFLVASASLGCEAEEVPLSTLLACTPATVTSGEFVTLSMESPHGGDLSVTDPAGTFFFLVRGGQSQTQSLTLSGDFAEVESVELDVEGAMATPYVYGDSTAVLLFEQAGAYQFRLSENLETDDGTPSGECSVAYQP